MGIVVKVSVQQNSCPNSLYFLQASCRAPDSLSQDMLQEINNLPKRPYFDRNVGWLFSICLGPEQKVYYPYPFSFHFFLPKKVAATTSSFPEDTGHSKKLEYLQRKSREQSTLTCPQLAIKGKMFYLLTIFHKSSEKSDRLSVGNLNLVLSLTGT